MASQICSSRLQWWWWILVKYRTFVQV
jgi:hypothetical protein